MAVDLLKRSEKSKKVKDFLSKCDFKLLSRVRDKIEKYIYYLYVGHGNNKNLALLYIRARRIAYGN